MSSLEGHLLIKAVKIVMLGSRVLAIFIKGPNACAIQVSAVEMTNVFQFHITGKFLALDFQWSGVRSKGRMVVSKKAGGRDIFVAHFPFEVSYRDGIDGDPLFS